MSERQADFLTALTVSVIMLVSATAFCYSAIQIPGGNPFVIVPFALVTLFIAIHFAYVHGVCCREALWPSLAATSVLAVVVVALVGTGAVTHDLLNDFFAALMGSGW